VVPNLPPPSAPAATRPINMPACLRYIYRGETLRMGRVLELEELEDDATHVAGSVILQALRSDVSNVPEGVVPFYYEHTLEGWKRCLASSSVAIGERGRVEVMLEAPAAPLKPRASDVDRLASGAVATVGEASSRSAAEGGFFGVGVYNSKSVDNVGTMWRSAYMLGASFIFTIGQRNAWEKACDTYKAWRHVPAYRYDDWAGFCAAAPYSATWVAVEMGGTPLHAFEHPERAVYVLGAEDAGLPAAVVRACHRCVSLDGVRASSYNVATAATLIMYDRMRKFGADADAPLPAPAILACSRDDGAAAPAAAAPQSSATPQS
jgi:tRNA(Leu) C34 or U34 (ribose-2'-O)-methylase TrmL